MKEAFDIMGSHPMLTIFLGGILIVIIISIEDIITEIVRRYK